jgi:HAD superfamily hydrolase (TIGR01509 family)
MLQALIFDLDGTLVNSAPLHYEALQAVLAERSISLDQNWYQRQLGMTFAGMLERLEESSGQSLPLKEILARTHQIFLNQLERLTIHEDVAALARALHGRVALAVASNGHRQVVEASLQATGLRPLFDTVVSLDDVAAGKPAPDMFLEAARRLGAAPEFCQVLEDSDEGLEAARRAGIPARDVRQLRQVRAACA